LKKATPLWIFAATLGLLSIAQTSIFSACASGPDSQNLLTGCNAYLIGLGGLNLLAIAGFA
jgi:hypothetical protein